MKGTMFTVDPYTGKWRRVREMGEAVTDQAAVDAIYQLMDGEEWEPETLDQIAYVIELTGREIHEPGFYEEQT